MNHQNYSADLDMCIQTKARLGLFIALHVNEMFENDQKISHLQKSFFHLTRVEWFPVFPGLGQHRHDVVMPKDPISCVNLGNVAKQPFCVNFRQN